MKCDHLIGRTFDGDVYILASDVMEAVAELKEKLMPCLNGDCILTCEVVEKYGKENAELKQKLDKAIAERDGNQVCIDALKAKLENVQASMYADVVDANMENRRLKRALYKACAEWALSTIAWLDCIGQGNPVKYGEMRRKCLEKVEEYK